MKLLWTATLLSGLIFAALLSSRIAMLRPPEGPVIASAEIPGKDIWMNISQKGRKIGYSHRLLFPETDRYTLEETVFMRINTMGVLQTIRVHTEAVLNMDLSLRSFAFTTRSSRFEFQAVGRVENGQLVVMINGQESAIPIERTIYLASGILDAFISADLEPGQSVSYQVFDPSTMGQRPVKITMVGYEILTILGRSELTRKVSVDFMGSRQTAWIAEDGSIVREAGLMGIELERVSEKQALDGLLDAASQDLTQLVSIAVDVPIDTPEAYNRMKVRLSGIDDALQLDGGRQQYTDNQLIIQKEVDPAREPLSKQMTGEFLASTPFIQADDPQIEALARRLVAATDPPRRKVEKLMQWVYQNIEKRPVLSVPNAKETLERKMGDCNEHAVLLAALARSVGIPAQVEAGLVYTKGRFYYHAWNSLYVGYWLTADALMGQMPADVTHVRLVRGNPSAQIDLIQVIGRLKMEIVELS
jgi:hypothetical protein